MRFLRWYDLAAAIALATATAVAAAEAETVGRCAAWPFFVFQNGLGGVPLDEQPKLLKELGYDGIELEGTLSQVPSMIRAIDAQRLKLFCVYTGVNLAPGRPPYEPDLKAVIERLKGRDTLITLFVVDGHVPNANVEQRAVAIVREIAAAAAQSGLRIALYPHAGHYLPRVQDALRLARRVDRKNVGVCFNLCHFLKVDDQRQLEERLKEAMPWLFAVSINGADGGQTNELPWNRLIQTLDRGSLNVGRVLKTLEQLRYRGPIGLQCCGIPGEPRDNLKRSMRAWRNLCGRSASGRSEASLRIEDPRCEYLRDPVGMDVAKPRLSWILQSNARGQRQTAYQVLVASDEGLLASDTGDVWDSGKVQSDRSIQVLYRGAPLASSTSYYWKVRVWDRDGRATAWSQPAVWTTGLMRAQDWQARWIGMDTGQAASDDAPSPWLRKTFVLRKTPERALAYVNSLGYHELYVNGRKVGADVLGPAVSDFSKRSLYLAYDIRSYLQAGRNCVGVWLGRGWHVSGRLGVSASGPAVRFQAEIRTGEKTSCVLSDDTWKCAASSYATLGPWRWNQYGGERYDARRDNPQWSAAEYDDHSWATVQSVVLSAVRAESQLCPRNRIGQRIQAVACTDLGNGRYELDFGTNLAGWLRMRMPPLQSGRRVVIRYADKRDTAEAPKTTDANLSDETVDSAAGKVHYQTYHQRDEFIAAGRMSDVFCSKFNYHGFRYAIVDGLPRRPVLADAEALLVESDLASVGSFACSNDLLNRIDGLNRWTIRCLDLGGYLVDCPHRERYGYGDGQVSAETCLLNFWMPNFYQKWLQDWCDAQDTATGAMPPVAPRLDGHSGAPAWGGALAALSWRMYLYYGDRRILEANYEPMRRYVDHLESRCRDNLLHPDGDKWYFLGDWVAPGRGMDNPANYPSARAKEVFNNCYRVYLWELLERSASALRQQVESRRCRAKLDAIRPLIHREYYDPGKHTYVLDDQPYLCLPLATGVTPSSEREAVLQKLVEGIRIHRNGHLDSGMLGTYFLIQYLPTIHRDDLLFRIVNQRTYPGWGHMLANGATTMWEQWNGYWSQIHSCFTSIGGWFYNSVAGIQPDPAAAGFENIIIRPAVVGDLTWAKSSFRSIRGLIVSDWKRDNGTFTLKVTIPANTTATVYVPTKSAESVTESGRAVGDVREVKYLRQEIGCAVFVVESGQYSFSVARLGDNH